MVAMWPFEQDLLRLHADLGDGVLDVSKSPAGPATAPAMVAGFPGQAQFFRWA
jgi:hypothetical protein